MSQCVIVAVRNLQCRRNSKVGAIFSDKAHSVYFGLVNEVSGGRSKSYPLQARKQLRKKNEQQNNNNNKLGN